MKRRRENNQTQPVEPAITELSANRIYRSDDTLSFSGIEAQSRSVSLPRARVNYVRLYGEYTVTDASITAGETLQGIVSSLTFGEGSDTPLSMRRDELSILSDFRAPPGQTCYVDDTPTTATAQKMYYEWRGPFDFSHMTDPVASLAISNVTDEWGTASTFIGTFHVECELSEDQTIEGSNYLVRVQKDASTQHDRVATGDGILKEFLLVTTTGTVTEVRMNARSSIGAPLKNRELAVDNVDDSYAMNIAYARMRGASSITATRFLVTNLSVDPFVERNINIKLSASSTLLCFTREVVMRNE